MDLSRMRGAERTRELPLLEVQRERRSSMSLIATLGRCAGYTFGALLDELYPVQAVPRAQDQADLLQEAEAEEEVWEPEDIPAGVSAPSPPVAAPPAGLTWAQYIEP